MRSLGTVSVVVGLLVSLSGCEGKDADVFAQLKPLKGCLAVEGAIREMALTEMNRRIDEALENALQNSGLDCLWERGYYDDADLSASGAPAPQAAGGGTTKAAENSGASQVSGTNNQVAGVDEADFVKNDNKYIYIVSGKHFRIIEAWPAPDTKEIAKVEVEGEPRKLFVQGDRVLIYSSMTSTASSEKSYPGSYSRGECTYGYNCSFTGDGNPTQITVLDISDRTAPREIRKLMLSGSYVNARRIGAAVFTVLSSPGVKFDGLKYYPEISIGCGNPVPRWQIINAFEQLRSENAKLIKEAKIGDWLPSVEDKILVGSNAGTTSELLTGCEGFYRSSISDGGQFTTLLALNMTKERPATASTIVSRPGAVYSSAGALYISVPHTHAGMGWYPSMRHVSEASTVHKFVLDANTARAAYAASGVVKGRVLNQFAMDEMNGYLRMATTTGRVPNPDVHSTLTVLHHRGKSLEAVGQLDNLAPSEDIRSVRFDGDRGFVVTFKKTDPLFIFDLSNPFKPKTLAELKIPGFSTYMHMMDKNHLMSIGYDADDQGSFAWFTGVMLQIFDVTYPTRPKRIHKEVIGTRGSSSEALTNHLAFTYFAPKDLLALPMTVCEGGSGGGSYGTNMTFSGLMVYNVTTAAGFSLRGQVDHPVGDNIDCSNWWTNATSQVKRSIIMDDYVFSISSDLIKVNNLNSLPNDVASLPIAD